MEHKKKEDGIEREVLIAIASGKVKMRPRWQFILQAALLLTGAAILLFALLYLVSFIIFILHETGAWFVPAFGMRGWFALFLRLPWTLIGLVVIFIVVLELLVRRYAFAYHRPLLASALTIVGIVLIGGALISATRFHSQLFDFARHNGLPVIGGMYRGYGMPGFDDIHRGQIVAMTTGTFVFQEDDGDTSTVILTPVTRLPLGGGFAVATRLLCSGRKVRTASFRHSVSRKSGNDRVRERHI